MFSVLTLLQTSQTGGQPYSDSAPYDEHFLVDQSLVVTVPGSP